MTRPDGFGGPPFAGPPQWGPPAPWPGQYHPGQPYPGRYHPAGGPPPPYPPPPAPWPGAAPHVAPPQAAPRRSGAGRKPVLLVLVGLVVLALLGGGALLVSGVVGARDQAAPVLPVSAPGADPAVVDPGPVPGGPAASNVTIALPPTIDGRQQLDSPIAKALVDPMREQLAATASADAVVGLYSNPDQSPAFLVAASTTTYDTEDLLTGMASGMQQSAAGDVAFVDQPAGPLGGTMRCAETDGMTMCLWGADGAFGLNMVYNQNLAEAAATTLRVREAVEKHSA